MFRCAAALTLVERQKNHSVLVTKSSDAETLNDRMVDINIESLTVSNTTRKAMFFNFQYVLERPNGRSEFSSLCAYATEMFTAASRPSRPGSMSKVTF